MPEFTVPTSKEQLYRDVSLTFAKNPVTSDVATVTGIEAVKRSLRFLLLSEAGETPFYLTFGTQLRRLLFEPADPITEILIRNEIQATIAAFEPRVQITSLTVTLSADETAYQVNLIFSVLPQYQSGTLSLFLSRVR